MTKHANGSAKPPSGGEGGATRGSPVTVPAQDVASRPNVPQRVIRFFDSTTKVLVAIGSLIAAITGLVTLVVQLLPAGQASGPSPPAVQGTGQSSALQSTALNGPPVKIDAVSVVRNVLQGGTYVFPQKRVLTAAELRTLNQFNLTQPQYDTWFRSRGAVDPEFSNLKLVVEGNRTHPVQVTGLRLIKHCQQPLDGTLFASPPGGSNPTLRIGFNLDSPASIAQDYRGSFYPYPMSGDYFAEHTISLSRSEVQTLQVSAITTKQYCEYILELTAVDGGTTVTETITDHGRPFRVTALKFANQDPYSDYKALYVGGVLTRKGAFIAENPATYSSG